MSRGHVKNLAMVMSRPQEDPEVLAKTITRKHPRWKLLLVLQLCN